MGASRSDLNPARSDTGLGGIVGGLATDLQAPVRGEIVLARAEMDQKFHSAVAAGTWVGGAALLGFAGLVIAIEGVAELFARAMPAWIASMLVGVVVIAIGGVSIKSGLGMLSSISLTPDRSVASLQKDARIVKEHTNVR
jgi:hypothetical protein